MDFTQLLSLLETYGAPFAITSIVCYALLEAVLLGKKYMTHKIENSGNQKVITGGNFESMKDLINHPFFYENEYLMTNGLDKVDFKGEVRSQLFKDMFQEKVRTFDLKYKKFLQKTLSNEKEWFQEQIALIGDAISLYKSKWMDMGVPTIAIKKFEKWHRGREQYALNQLEVIRDCEIFDSIPVKTKHSLDLLQHLLGATLIDLYNAAEELNGELTDKPYRGRKIEALKH